MSVKILPGSHVDNHEIIVVCDPALQIHKTIWNRNREIPSSFLAVEVWDWDQFPVTLNVSFWLFKLCPHKNNCELWRKPTEMFALASLVKGASFKGSVGFN